MLFRSEPLSAARSVPETARRMLDVGSGGGSPAIPLALASGSLRLLMVESRTKKAVFLREAARLVYLDAEVANARVEELSVRPELRESQDLVTTRAVRLDVAMLTLLQTFLAPDGQLFLFGSRGALPPADSLPAQIRFSGSRSLLTAANPSQLVLLKKQKPATH